MKSRQRRIALLLSISLIATLTGCNNKEKVEETVEDVAIVDTMQPQKGDVKITNDFIATIEPEDTVNVIAMASGEVLNVNVEVGDVVSEGDVLANIDDTTYQINLASAKLRQDTAQRSYDLSYGNGANTLNDMDSKNTLDNAEDGVYDVQESIVDNMDSLQHYKDLLKEAEDALDDVRDEYGYKDDPEEILEYAHENNTVGGEQYNWNQSRYSTAKTLDAMWQQKIDSYKNAIDQYEEAIEKAEEGATDGYKSFSDAVVADGIKNGELREEQKKISSNSISDAALVIESAQNNLDYCTIKASVSGVIEAVNLDEHSMASTGTPAFVIAQKDVMMATYYVSEEIRNTFSLGQTVSLNKDGVDYEAEVDEIGSTVDAATGLFKIKASIKGDASKLLSGTKATVTTDTYHETDALYIPYDAVYYESGTPYVYTVVDGRAKKTYITTGLSNNDSIVVTDGLNATDVIVTTWAAQLRDGVLVSNEDEQKAAEEETEAAKN